MKTEELRGVSFFRNMTDEEIEHALELLHCRQASYEKEQLVFMEGDLTDEMGVVLSGNVRIERIDYQGNRNILSYVGKGQMFAETYALLENEPLMVDVVAGTACRIVFLNLKRLSDQDVQETTWHSKIVLNLLRISNMKNLELSRRNFHTFSKHVRGRVLSYLTAQAAQNHSDSFDIPLNRQQMADYLNLDRSALSKELSKMQEEGIIAFTKNHFTLMKK